MEIAVALVALVLCVALLSGLADRLGAPAPLLLVVVGVGLSLIPAVPEVELEPELILVGVLPPLLYSAAYNTSFVDFRNKKGAIASLSVGLVVATTVAVGLVLWWLLPGLPLAVGCALGAVVAPPDAVAATAIARRVGMPAGIVQVLEGESLVNDATALTALRTALAAFAGAITVMEVGVDFLIAAGGGAVVGLIVGYLVVRGTRALGGITSEVSIGNAITFTVPYLAFLPAEEVGASGVIAVVVAGLFVGHRAPLLRSGTARLTAQSNWRTISLLLENGVFLLIGLQLHAIVDGAGASGLPVGRLEVMCGGVFLTVVAVRFAWVYLSGLLGALPRSGRTRERVDWGEATVVGWAGMRGVVTLAAALSLPDDVPYRDALTLVAFFVVVASLLLQGSTLPWLVRRLRLPPPDEAQLALQDAVLLDRAAQAGLARLDEIVGPDDQTFVVDRVRARVADRRNAAWERAAAIGSGAPPAQRYAELRLDMMAAERAEIVRARDEGAFDDEVVRRVLRREDIEEAMLDQPWSSAATRGNPPDLPDKVVGHCAHLDATEDLPLPNESVCESCVVEGTTWVSLRMCLTCGYRGCCDSSPGRHASAHFRHFGHPVMRSIEPGESWRWCYVDHLVGRGG